MKQPKRLKIFISSVQKEFQQIRLDLKAFLMGDAVMHRFISGVFLFEELPPDAIGEAIVNSIAHRDYHTNASVEVRLFADRLEVWNPGRLPGTLTFDDLRRDHPSIPNNPLIAESLYLTRYIEKAGSGTQRMIELCREAGLIEPQFEQRSGSFVLTLWRDWLTDKVLAGYSINERERRAVQFLKIHGTITNSQYQREFLVAKRTASLDLAELVAIGLIEKTGSTGKGVYYRLAKGAAKGQKGLVLLTIESAIARRRTKIHRADPISLECQNAAKNKRTVNGLIKGSNGSSGNPT